MIALSKGRRPGFLSVPPDIVCSMKNLSPFRGFASLLGPLSAAFLCAGSLRGEQVHIPPHTFTIPDGFTLEKVATSPQIERPIHLAFDAEGILYATDSSGNTESAPKQNANPTHRVLRLLDADGDGVYEHSSVFADKLSFPEGLLWRDGALFVSAPPNIWKLRDTDGDHQADQREVWLQKSVLGCGNDLHGPYAGPDGFLYWTKGEFAEQKHRLGNGRDFVSRAAHIFRARPDRSGLEVVMTGGMNNPVGVAFSPTGERFLSGTFLDLSGGGKRDGILHAVYGGVYGRTNGVLEGHPRTGDLLPVLVQQGPSAASGMIMARSNALGLQGRLLCTQFNLHKVSQHVLTAEGNTFRSADSDLVVSDHVDFHPTDILEDADGSLLLVDTGGWYKICCPTSKTEKPAVLGAVYRLRKKDMPQAKDPRGTRLDWKNASPEELASRVQDTRLAVADRAVDHLVARSAVPELAGVAAKRELSADARLRALWGLVRIEGSEARIALRAFLEDGNPQVQMVAATGVGLWRDRGAKEKLLAQLSSTDATVRRAATEALGRLGDKSVVAALLKTPPTDRFGFHAAAYALYEIGVPESLQPDAEGTAGELSRTVHAMFSTPKPATNSAPILVTPAAAADPALRAQQQSRLDALAPQTLHGDVQRGAELFRSTKAMCATCHAVAHQGGEFGPDLTKIGGIRTHRDLLEAIVYPSSSLVRNYDPVLLKTRSGAEHYGILKNDAPAEITLATSPVSEVRVARADVLSLMEGSVSLMPPGFDGVLSPAELADLIAYLLTLR